MILIRPDHNHFEEVIDSGVALGVDEGFIYEENVKSGLKLSQIIAIGTDGIWEARNRYGEMFGKVRFREIIEHHSKAAVNDMVDAICQELKDFTLGVKPHDDVTLVCIKIVEER